MRAELLREAARKAFHMLSLVYLAAYHVIGYPAVLFWLAAWSAVVVAVELARLSSRALNDFLHAVFRGLARPEEYGRVSGIFHATLGALAVIFLFGSEPRIVSAALLCEAFGDAAAALFGKSFGRHPLPFGRKSWEGSAACFAVCLAIGLALGFGAGPALAMAAVATAVELAPTTAWFNDNLWMPVGAGAALKLCAG